MATAGSLLTNIQKLFGDPEGDFITNTFGLDCLDRAQQRFCHKVLPLDEYKDYTITAKEELFDLPADCIIPIWVEWYKSRTTKLEYTTPDQWAHLQESNPNATGIPERYTVIRRQLAVGPQVPTTASGNTTASGAITASAVTLGLAAASGTFRSKGFVKVNSEVIKYTGVATTTLTGCTRGVHNTTAASHASGDTVTQIDLIMLYRKSPAALATSSTPDVPTVYQAYLEKYALYLAWLARGDSAKADAALSEFADIENDAIKTIGRRSMDGMMRIKEKINRWRWW